MRVTLLTRVVLNFLLVFAAVMIAASPPALARQTKDAPTAAATAPDANKTELRAAADELAGEVNALYDSRHIEFQTARHLAFRVERLRDADAEHARLKTCDGRESRRPMHEAPPPDPKTEVRVVLGQLDMLVAELFDDRARAALTKRVAVIRDAAERAGLVTREEASRR